MNKEYAKELEERATEPEVTEEEFEQKLKECEDGEDFTGATTDDR